MFQFEIQKRSLYWFAKGDRYGNYSDQADICVQQKLTYASDLFVLG
ncbi:MULTISPECIES: hypothetical protein [unclassified Coleofasciculus]|nr:MULTISPECIES: hypothetical protein [unclassified Coleofasciculus]MBD1893852.1 hypothetical protein [Coleofasciculus sp. FACHB-129]MBD2086955.1 hypothetical protein [Coleofasciculus sp. FACHB-542]